MKCVAENYFSLFIELLCKIYFETAHMIGESSDTTENGLVLLHIPEFVFVESSKFLLNLLDKTNLATEPMAN